MSISGAITEIQKILKKVNGIRTAPESPSGTLSANTTAIAFEGPGAWVFGSAGSKKWLGEIVVQVHHRGDDIERAITALLPLGEAVPNELMADLVGENATGLGGNISTFESIQSSGIVAMSYSDIQTMGYEFRITGIKIESEISSEIISEISED